jgi:hypothetical protein
MDSPKRLKACYAMKKLVVSSGSDLPLKILMGFGFSGIRFAAFAMEKNNRLIDFFFIAVRRTDESLLEL